MLTEILWSFLLVQVAILSISIWISFELLTNNSQKIYNNIDEKKCKGGF